MTLLEQVVADLQAATGVQVSYGRARTIEGPVITVTQDETAEDTMFAERGFDIDVYAPGPDPSVVERLRRSIERTLHYRLMGETDDAGAVRLRVQDQAYVEDEDDYTHWTMRVIARIFRLDAARAKGGS